MSPRVTGLEAIQLGSFSDNEKMFTSSKDLSFFINKIKKESSPKVPLKLLNHRAYSQYQLTGKAREHFLKAQTEK